MNVTPRWTRQLAIGALAACALWAPASHAQAPGAAPTPAPIAGLQPDRRPPGAPSLVAAAPSPTLKQRRLSGIGQPWPGNVERIAEQGAWFSPMFAPGMGGRYDLRGLHGGANP